MPTVSVTRNYFGQEGDVRVGTVLSVSAGRAKYLVENRLAVLLEESPATTPAQEEPHTSAPEPEPELEPVEEPVPTPSAPEPPFVEVTPERMTFGRPSRRKRPEGDA